MSNMSNMLRAMSNRAMSNEQYVCVEVVCIAW